MFAFFKKITSSIGNTISVFGNNNHILNIVNADSSSFGYDPHIDWNTTPQAGGGYSAQLEWRTRLTPIIGRDAEQKALLDWANDAPQLSFKIVEAPGGTGKTRLAAEVAQTLSETKNWSAGFVQLLDFEKAQRLQWQGNWLIVIDYPEHAPDRLAALFRIAKAGLAQKSTHKLRVLLLCRSQDGIGEKLGASGVKGYLSSDLKLKELPTQDNFELLTKALAKLMPQKAMSVDKTAFEDWQRQSTLHQTALFVLALALHLSTYPAINQQFLPGKDLLFALLDREKLRWKKAEEGLNLPSGTLADVIAIATLFNGLPAADLNTVLTRHYSWSKPTADKVLTALAEVWHADTSNATVYPALAPDLLAAVFLWDWQSYASKRGNVQDMVVIAKLTEARDTETESLLQRWHMQAYDQTMRLSLGRSSDICALSFLLEKIADQSTEFLKLLNFGFIFSTTWPALSSLASYCSKPQITHEIGDLLQLTNHASQLHNHSNALSFSGDRIGALLAAQKAVTIRRRLVAANPTYFEPKLAETLSMLANRLSENGDRLDALLASKEAVAIFRHLTAVNPSAFEPNLAKSMSNLSSRLGDTGDHAGALQVAIEAESIHRKLAEINTPTFESNLATSMNNLANCLSSTGNLPGAMLAALEAVTIHRRLAANDPAAFEHKLAMNLTSLASYWSETIDYQGSLLPAQEAVAIYKRLAVANPAVFEPDLAASVCNLANRLSQTGDRPSALLAAKEAVTIYRRLAATYPAKFETDLALSLWSLANRLHEKDDTIEALLAAQESLKLYENANKLHAGIFVNEISSSLQQIAYLKDQNQV